MVLCIVSDYSYHYHIVVELRTTLTAVFKLKVLVFAEKAQ